MTGPARYFYTPLAFAVAAILFVRFPAAYLVHVWLDRSWMFVRRVVDFHSGWTEFSPIMLAPYVSSLLNDRELLSSASCRGSASAICFRSRRFWSEWGWRTHRIMNAGFSPATFDALNWFLPVIMGVHVAFSWLQL